MEETVALYAGLGNARFPPSADTGKDWVAFRVPQPKAHFQTKRPGEVSPARPDLSLSASYQPPNSVPTHVRTAVSSAGLPV